MFCALRGSRFNTQHSILGQSTPLASFLPHRVRRPRLHLSIGSGDLACIINPPRVLRPCSYIIKIREAIFSIPSQKSIAHLYIQSASQHLVGLLSIQLAPQHLVGVSSSHWYLEIEYASQRPGGISTSSGHLSIQWACPHPVGISASSGHHNIPLASQRALRISASNGHLSI